MAQIQFGTDGWRAVIAEDFTFENLARVAQAAAIHWKQDPAPSTQPLVVVGFDRRFLSDAFALRTAEILAGNGLRVLLSKQPLPTPSVSFAVHKHHAVGGVMITASHNPPRFNGFKLKAHYGGSADPALCKAVENCLDRTQPRSLSIDSAEGRHAVTRADLRPPHFAALKRLVDFPLIAQSGLRFAHEALYGVGAGCFETLLARTTCRVTTLHADHDPSFGGINPEPVEANYGDTRAYLSRHPHDVCLVTDGDADRVGGMDGRGRLLSTHQIIALLLRHFVVHRKASGRVIKAITTTSMVDKMCAAWNLPLVETGVGFKYICAEMLKGDTLLGFEESGGIGFPGHIPERDGILAGLMLLECLATERKPVGALVKNLEREFGPHRYARIDAHFPLEKRADLMAYCRNNPPARLLRSPLERVADADGVKFIARNGSWLMLRGSGTEPILRIYAEAPSDSDARALLRLGVKLTRQA